MCDKEKPAEVFETSGGRVAGGFDQEVPRRYDKTSCNMKPVLFKQKPPNGFPVLQNRSLRFGDAAIFFGLAGAGKA